MNRVSSSTEEVLLMVRPTMRTTVRFQAQIRRMRRLESRWSTYRTTSTSTLSLIANKLKSSYLSNNRRKWTRPYSTNLKNSWLLWSSAIMPFRTLKEQGTMITMDQDRPTRASTKTKNHSCSSLTPLTTNSCQGGTGYWPSWNVESRQGLMRSSLEEWHLVMRLWRSKLWSTSSTTREWLSTTRVGLALSKTFCLKTSWRFVRLTLKSLHSKESTFMAFANARSIAKLPLTSLDV